MQRKFLGLILIWFFSLSANAEIEIVSFDSGKSYGTWIHKPHSDYSSAKDSILGQEREINEFYFGHAFNNTTLHLAHALTAQQNMYQVGVEFDDFSLFAYSGDGDTLSTFDSAFENIDPFHFHGGLRHKYQYQGFQAQSYFGQNHQLLAGTARITSPFLEDRTVFQLGFSKNDSYVLFQQVDRGSEKAGESWQVGHSFKSHTAEAQWLVHENGASLFNLNYKFQASKNLTYRLSLGHRENPLYERNNGNQFLVGLSYQFSRPQYKVNATETTEDDAEAEAGKKKKQGAMVGVGAIAVGVGLSSGSGSSDSSRRLEAQHAAARAVLNDINPVSVRLNREHGGYVFRNADGTFSSTTPIQGGVASVALPNPIFITPQGSVTTASYHTHGGPDPRFDNENFSATDIASDREFGLDGYLGTPGGQFKFHDVNQGTITTLGRIAND